MAANISAGPDNIIDAGHYIDDNACERAIGLFVMSTDDEVWRFSTRNVARIDESIRAA